MCAAVPVLDGQPGAGNKNPLVAGLVFQWSGVILGQGHSQALEVSCRVLFGQELEITVKSDFINAR